MDKTDAYVVMTNNAINIITTDPNVADQAKAKAPGSIVKRFPLTSKMQGTNGLVGEALEGDFDMGDEPEDQSIGQDDVEFVDGPPPAEDGEQGQEAPMGGEDVDVLCMDVPLAIRMFEYVTENQVTDEALHELVEHMTALGNESDDVLTMEHYDQIVGEQDQGDQAFDDQQGGEEDDLDGYQDGDENADDGMTDQGDEQVRSDLEIGESGRAPRRQMMRNRPMGGSMGRARIPEDAFDGETSDDQLTDEPKYSNQSSAVDSYDEQLVQQFMAGEMSREDLIDALQSGANTDYSMRQGEMGNPDMRADMQQGRQRMVDPYGDDMSDEFGEYDREDDDEEFDECIDYGTRGMYEDDQQGQGQAPAQPNPALDAAYMNGYNTGKRGAQAQQQNINQPAGVAYNRGFTDGKAGQQPIPPSKQKTEQVMRESAASGKFHVYHKAKGDRMGGPDYDYIKSFDDKEAAQAYIDTKPKQKNSFHSYVIRTRRITEGVETFAAFLSAVEKKSPVPNTVSKLFSDKKQKAAKAPVAEEHFEIVQDPKTTAVKIVDSAKTIAKSTQAY